MKRAWTEMKISARDVQVSGWWWSQGVRRNVGQQLLKLTDLGTCTLAVGPVCTPPSPAVRSLGFDKVSAVSTSTSSLLLAIESRSSRCSADNTAFPRIRLMMLASLFCSQRSRDEEWGSSSIVSTPSVQQHVTRTSTNNALFSPDVHLPVYKLLTGELSAHVG